MLLQLKFVLFDMINVFLRSRFDLYKRQGKLSKKSVCFVRTLLKITITKITYSIPPPVTKLRFERD